MPHIGTDEISMHEILNNIEIRNANDQNTLGLWISIFGFVWSSGISIWDLPGEILRFAQNDNMLLNNSGLGA